MSEPVFLRSSAPEHNPPPPPAPTSSDAFMVPPLPSHVNQRRVVEAVVRTNPRLRHQASHPPPIYQYPFHHPRSTPQRMMSRQYQQQQQQLQQQHPNIQRFHSEESLASRGGGAYDGHHGGMYASRIHSSADEISSLNRSPSLTSDDDQSLDDGAVGGGEESEVRSSPPSRPPSHAPWMYPSDIRIDPSSLEVSPRLERAAADHSEGAQKRLPTLGQSPSPTPQQGQSSRSGGAAAAAAALRLQRRQEQGPPASASELESELDFDDDGADRLCDRLDLPPGVTGVDESCRSAMSSDLDFDRGDSCGSFEFLSRGHGNSRPRRPSALAEDSIQEETGDDELNPEEEDEDERLFCPKRRGTGDGVLPGATGAEQAHVLRQIQELGMAAGHGSAGGVSGTNESGGSRKSSRSSNCSSSRRSSAGGPRKPGAAAVAARKVRIRGMSLDLLLSMKYTFSVFQWIGRG